MQIFALIAVVIVSFISVIIGLDEVVPPKANSAVPSAVSTGAGTPDQSSAVRQATPQPAGAAPLPFPPPVTDGGGTAPIVMPDLPKTADSGAPKCNIEACKAAYRSFTEADCTYQPLEGPRRLCTR